MYSRSKGMTRPEPYMMPPPGYAGSRFRKRSDGRDEAFLAAYIPPSAQPEPIHETDDPKCDCTEEAFSLTDGAILPDKCDDEKEECPLQQRRPLQGIGEEEILLISLILILAGGTDANMDMVLLLALLLCIS